LRLRTHSLGPPVLLHVANNAFAFALALTAAFTVAFTVAGP